MDKQEMLQYLESKAQEFYDLSDCVWDFAEVRLAERKSYPCSIPADITPAMLKELLD